MPNSRMVCDVEGWAESLCLWANMVYGDDAYARVYDDQVARETFLMALPEEVQDAVLIMAREFFPPVSGFYGDRGVFVSLN